MKAIKITFSGDYKASNNEIFGFDNIEVIVPSQDQDIAVMHAMARQLPMALAKKAQKKESDLNLKAIKQMRNKYADKIEEVEHEFSFENKDIREMTFEEIQDVAVMFDLREVPLYKVGALRQQQNILYGVYSTKVLKEPINHKEEFFNVVDLPAIYVRTTPKSERVIKRTDEAQVEVPTTSLEQLKRIAESKGIKFHPRTGYDKLYELIYGVDKVS